MNEGSRVTAFCSTCRVGVTESRARVASWITTHVGFKIQREDTPQPGEGDLVLEWPAHTVTVRAVLDVVPGTNGHDLDLTREADRF